MALTFSACGGGIPLRDQVSAGKIVALFTVIIVILLVGLYGARPRD